MRLIDADALIDKYGDWYTEEGTEEGYIGTIKGIVDSMPTIEPEWKKGEWIGEKRQRLIDETDDGCVYMTDTWWYCSECRNPKGYMGHKPEDKYCNECGARMEDVESDEQTD